MKATIKEVSFAMMDVAASILTLEVRIPEAGEENIMLQERGKAEDLSLKFGFATQEKNVYKSIKGRACTVEKQSDGTYKLKSIIYPENV